MNCLLCNSQKIDFKFSYNGNDIYLKRINKIDFKLDWFECASCGVFFSKQYQNIRDVYSDLDLYDAQYDKDSIKERFEAIMSLDENSSDNAMRVKRIKSFHNRYITNFDLHRKPFSILDVGAGLGVFLSKFLDNNFVGTALEVNKIAANHLKKSLNIKVYQKKIQDVNSRLKFDIITMNRVIEHIKEPIEALSFVHKIVKKNGYIYIELPDVFSYRFSGNKSDAFASGHYTVYSPKSLSWLLERCGFDILTLDRVLEPSNKFTIFAFAKKVGV